MPLIPILFVVVGMGASPVIAAPGPIDHSGATPDGSASTIVRLAIGLGAVAAIALIAWRRWASLRRPPGRPMAFAPMTALLMAMACLVLGWAGAAVVGRLAGIDFAAGEALSRVDRVRLELGALAGQLIVVGLYAWQVLVTERSETDTRPPWWRSVVVGTAAMLLVWPVLIVIGWGLVAIVERIQGVPPDPIAHDTLRILVESPADGWYAALILIVVLGAPVTEELLYRGLLQDALRRAGVGPWPAIGLSAAIFAYRHVGITAPHTLVLLFGLGVCFGWAFERTGRLSASIAMHATFNVGNVLLATSAG
ncbi:MAG: CPBP family intramembrane metalloprotease [Planctomycetes bacterium]|nr:CPBP family intramembrane metalloprotease [Planctomycetota bacterium]